MTKGFTQNLVHEQYFSGSPCVNSKVPQLYFHHQAKNWNSNRITKNYNSILYKYCVRHCYLQNKMINTNIVGSGINFKKHETTFCPRYKTKLYIQQ